MGTREQKTHPLALGIPIVLGLLIGLTGWPLPPVSKDPLQVSLPLSGESVAAVPDRSERVEEKEGAEEGALTSLQRELEDSRADQLRLSAELARARSTQEKKLEAEAEARRVLTGRLAQRDRELRDLKRVAKEREGNLAAQGKQLRAVERKLTMVERRLERQQAQIWDERQRRARAGQLLAVQRTERQRLREAEELELDLERAAQLDREKGLLASLQLAEARRLEDQGTIRGLNTSLASIRGELEKEIRSKEGLAGEIGRLQASFDQQRLLMSGKEEQLREELRQNQEASERQRVELAAARSRLEAAMSDHEADRAEWRNRQLEQRAEEGAALEALRLELEALTDLYLESQERLAASVLD